MNLRSDELSAVIAGEVRAELARRQMTTNEVAQQLGWTQPYLWRRMKGQVAFDVGDLAAIAELLEVPVTAFFGPAGGFRRPGTCPADPSADFTWNWGMAA